MLKRIFKTSFYSIVARFFITAGNLAVVYYISKNFDKASLGLYGIAFFFYQFFQSFSSMGMPIYIGKEIASLRENKDKTVNVFHQFVLANFYGLLSSFVILFIALAFYHKLTVSLLILAFIAGFLLGIERNLSGFLLGKERMNLESLANFVEFLLLITTLFIIPNDFFKTIVAIFVLRIFSLIVGVLLRFYFLKDMLSFKGFEFKFKTFKEVKFYWFSGLSYLFFRQIDVFILSFFFAKALIGEYFLSIRIFFAVGILAEVVSLALTPFISRVYNDKEEISFEKFRNLIFSVSLVVGIFLGGFLYVFREPLISFFNKSLIQACGPYLALLSIAIPFRFLIYILGSFMSSSKYQNVRLYLNIAGAFFFMIIVFILVNIFSIKGAIYSKILTEFFLFITYFYFVFFRMKRN